jgi:hypothetical protein
MGRARSVARKAALKSAGQRSLYSPRHPYVARLNPRARVALRDIHDAISDVSWSAVIPPRSGAQPAA